VTLEDDRIVASNLRAAVKTAPQHSIKDEGAACHVVSDVRGHKAILEDFIHAVQNNGTPACDAREGRKSLALIERIYRAARNSAGGGSD